MNYAKFKKKKEKKLSKIIYLSNPIGNVSSWGSQSIAGQRSYNSRKNSSILNVLSQNGLKINNVSNKCYLLFWEWMNVRFAD